jgi:hypothetical protein
MNENDKEETRLEDLLNVDDSSDELVALCFDCLSIIPESIASRDKFAMSGQSGVCPFCKGPMRIIPQGAVQGLQERRRRGEMINPGSGG